MFALEQDYGEVRGLMFLGVIFKGMTVNVTGSPLVYEFRDLEHFTAYKVIIRACHERDKKYPDFQLCSNPVLAVGMTKQKGKSLH